MIVISMFIAFRLVKSSSDTLASKSFSRWRFRCIFPVANTKLTYVIMIIILLPQVRAKLLEILESLSPLFFVLLLGWLEILESSSHLFCVLLLGWKQVAFVQSRLLQVTISSKQNSPSSAP